MNTRLKKEAAKLAKEIREQILEELPEKMQEVEGLGGPGSDDDARDEFDDFYAEVIRLVKAKL